MAKPVVLTPEGLKKLEDELEYLKVTGRTEIAERIKIARGFGDLSENAEYDAAKDAKASNIKFSNLNELGLFGTCFIPSSFIKVFFLYALW